MGRDVAVVLTPSAIADLREVRDHYREIDEDLAVDLVRELGHVIERLEMFPRSGMPVEGFDDVRRSRVRRYPYGVFYRLVEPGDVRILRILHDRRERSTALRDR